MITGICDLYVPRNIRTNRPDKPRNSLFVNDPFETVAEAFDNLYPGFNYTVFIVPKIDTADGKIAYGETFWPEGENIAVISISAELKIMDAVEVLAHEFAHVATPKEDHSTAWEEAFEKIHQEYERIITDREAVETSKSEV
jgi:hypothetical protein